MAKSVSINIKIDTKDGVKSLGDLEKETTTTLKTLKDMEEASELLNEKLKETEVGTEAYKQLRSELKKVNTEIKNQELAMEALDNEQVASELKSVAGGFVDMAGGMALVGSSNKSLEKVVQTMAQVEGATKIVTGAIESYQSMVKLSSTITGVFSKVMAFFSSGQAIAAAKTYALAAAQKVLNLVMNANPIGIIITAVTALIALVGTLTGAFDGIINAFKSLMGMQTESQKASEKADASLRKLYQNRIKDVKALMEAEREANEKRQTAFERDIAMMEALGKETEEMRVKMTASNLNSLNKQFEQHKYYNEQSLKDFNISQRKRFKTIDEGIEYYKRRVKERNRFASANDKAALMILEKMASNTIKVEGDVHQANVDYETAKRELRDKNHDAYMKQLEKEREYIEGSTDLWLKLDKLRAEGLDDEFEKRRRLAALEYEQQVRSIENAKGQEEAKIQILKELYRKYQDDLSFIDYEENKSRQKEAVKIEQGGINERVKLHEEMSHKVKETWADVVNNWQTKNAELIQKIQESFAIATEAINGIFQAAQDIMSEQAAQASFQREQQYSKEAESLKASLANREISQEQYENKLALLDQKKRNEERMAARKAFQMDKAMRISQAIMGTAQAVVSGLSAPFPLGVIQAGINAALGAVQVGIISAQKFRAARGGIVPGAPSSVDTVDAKLAQGEAVINSNSTQMFAPLLSAINEMGGGIPLVPSAGVTQGNTQPVFQQNQKQVVKAYVVESEMSDSQKKVSRIERAASFK